MVYWIANCCNARQIPTKVSVLAFGITWKTWPPTKVAKLIKLLPKRLNTFTEATIGSKPSNSHRRCMAMVAPCPKENRRS